MIITGDGHNQQLPDATKHKRYFNGWFIEKQGGDPKCSWDITKDMTLYAHWSANISDCIRYKDVSDLIDEDVKVAEKCISIISENITDSMTDYEKTKAIHDYLVLNTAYDYDNYIKGTVPQSSHEIEGALLNHKGVCSSYAAAFAVLMSSLDINCHYMSGNANGGPHGWDLIQLDGEWYHVVVPDQPGYVGYKYFLINDEQMSKDHSWTEKYYKCNSTKYMNKVN